jgi:hypothetical protein
VQQIVRCDGRCTKPQCQWTPPLIYALHAVFHTVDSVPIPINLFERHHNLRKVLARPAPRTSAVESAGENLLTQRPRICASILANLRTLPDQNP